jgi:PIN domain nuclease of toxin-antitoxin system
MPPLEKVSAVVLDTHVWIWMAAGDQRASQLRGYTGRLILPAISVWETAMLAAKGRLKLKPDVDTWVRQNLGAPVEMEPLSAEISIRSSRLGDFHGDPADRIIVATALALQMSLVTADQQIHEWNRKTETLLLIEL